MTDELITLTVRGPDGLTALTEALRIWVEDLHDMIGDNVVYHEDAEPSIYEMGLLVTLFIDNAPLVGCISKDEGLGLVGWYLDSCRSTGIKPMEHIAKWMEAQNGTQG